MQQMRGGRSWGGGWAVHSSVGGFVKYFGLYSE